MWTHENDFDSVIAAASSRYAVPVPVIKGIIGLESGFDVHAKRDEPQIRDASYGLMQVLYRTAQALGYSGTPDGLFDPAVNVALGTHFFGDLLRQAQEHGYGLDSALSSYNAGGSAVRPGDGKRATKRSDGKTADGGSLAPFVNQPYVDRVMSYVRYFEGKGGVSVGTPTVDDRNGGYAAPALLGVVAVLGLAVFFFQHAAVDASSLASFLVPTGQYGLIGWYMLNQRKAVKALRHRLEWAVNVLTQLAVHQGIRIVDPLGPQLVYDDRPHVKR